MSDRKARVLVVDDRYEMAEMLADGLRDQYDPVPLASSREALARLEVERVDAVVTDLRMPDVDGLQLLAAPRRLAPRRPVIVVTACGAIGTAIGREGRGGPRLGAGRCTMTTRIRQYLGAALLVAGIGAAASVACAHAPPATGDRNPDAGIDPDNPEINCRVNNTADCRPAAGP